jgi:hypothetical protein
MAMLTRRQLRELALEWPLPSPSDDDEPIDIDGWGWALYFEIGDNRTDQTENRAALEKIKVLTDRLDTLGIAWKKSKVAPRARRESREPYDSAVDLHSDVDPDRSVPLRARTDGSARRGLQRARLWNSVPDFGHLVEAHGASASLPADPS